MTTEPETVTTRPAWPVLVLAAPAFVAIWSGWVGLGELTGFGEVALLPGIWDAATINTAITLPIGVETYAAYAMTVWMAGGHEKRTRDFAKWSAIGALVLGAAGQVAYHLMKAAGVTTAPWQITTLVACLPVAVLGVGAALAHLVHADRLEQAATAQAAADAAQAAAADAARDRARQDAEDAHRRALETAQAEHRRRLDLAAQQPPSPTRTAPARRARKAARNTPARTPHTGDDVQRRRAVWADYEASVRSGTTWDTDRLTCALHGCTPDCTPDKHTPDPDRRKVARTRAAERRRAIEAETARPATEATP